MKRIRKINKIEQEAQFIKEKRLDYNLVKVLFGDWKGTKTEKEELVKVKKILKDDIYIEAIYILTHKIIRDIKQAKKLYYNIIDHHESLTKKLQRNVGIEVATLDFMKNISGQFEAPEVIEKKKLLKLATKVITDETTGAYDRTILNANLEVEVERSTRYRRPVSLLFCDLDDFKKLNDTHGHDVGDIVLKEAAKIIDNTIRNIDSVYRYGGEEFVAVLPETAIKDASIVARKICKKIASTKFSHKNSKDEIRVTLSIGAAQFGIDQIDTLESFIPAADQMMYKAKKAGKNCVCAYGINEKGIEVEKKESEIKKRQERSILSGQCISGGFALGKAFIYKDILTRDCILDNIKENEIDSELKRIIKAIEHVQSDLIKMKKVAKSEISKEHADIFEVHQEILKDEIILKDLEIELKKELINAEHAVKNVFRRWANKLKASENEAIKSKGEDLDDVSRRILRVLSGYEKNVLENLPPNSIVIAKRLLPSDTVHLKRENVKGVIVEQGSSNSHSAILSRTIGIPAIANPDKPIDLIQRGDDLMIDGEKEQCIVCPNEGDKSKYAEKISLLRKNEKVLIKKTKGVLKTRDGQIISIYANASSKEDFDYALHYGCERIGLLRIEQIYLSSKVLPDEKTLVKRFKKMLGKFASKEIIVRLLDIGGDKNLPYMEIEDEFNSILGLRGVRLLLKHENLLKTQIKAILSLKKRYNFQILIPMVTFAKEVKRVKEMVEECREELMKEKRIDIKDIKVGAMIETPAAVINIKEIAKVSDFLSIGTNDLVQYTMAAGREDTSIAQYYKEGAKVVIPSIRKIAEEANQNNIKCGICGEIAGDLKWTENLLKAGVRLFSVSPHRILPLKERIKSIAL